MSTKKIVAKLEEELIKRLDEGYVVDYLVLDFEQTSGLDNNFVVELTEYTQKLEKLGVRVAYAHLDKYQTNLLLRNGTVPLNKDTSAGIDWAYGSTSGKDRLKNYANKIFNFSKNKYEDMNDDDIELQMKETSEEEQEVTNYDGKVRGPFGKGIFGLNAFPYFQNVSRAVEYFEADILERFLYEAPQDEDLDPEEVEYRGAYEMKYLNSTLDWSNVPEEFVEQLSSKTVGNNPSRSQFLRLAQYGMTDEQFFDLPVIKPLPMKSLINIVEAKTYHTGDLIVHRKESVDYFIIVRQGIIECREERKNESSLANTIGKTGAGALLLIDGFFARNVSEYNLVCMAKETIVWKVYRKDFWSMVEKNIPTGAEFLFKFLLAQSNKNLHEHGFTLNGANEGTYQVYGGLSSRTGVNLHQEREASKVYRRTFQLKCAANRNKNRNLLSKLLEESADDEAKEVIY